MLGWIFKRKPDPAAAKPAAVKPDRVQLEGRPAGASAPSASAVPVAVDWQGRLDAAMGDDAALLDLARQGAAPLPVKLAAAGAVTGESVLKQAEREFRNHNRLVHRVLKERHAARVAQRQARDQAAKLIDAAAALAAEPLIPANRLVELHRAWQALDASLLEAERRADFDARFVQLTALARQRGDAALDSERWTSQARQAVARLQAVIAGAAAGVQGQADLAAADAAARAVVQGAPQSDAIVAAREALEGALGLSAALAERLVALEEVLSPAPTATTAADGDGAPTPADDSARQAAALGWQTLPPLGEPQLDAALERRFGAWREAREREREIARATRRQQDKGQQRASREARNDNLAAALQEAETAVAGGHLADAHRHLVAIDELLQDGETPEALRARLDRLHGQYAELKGWQHWGGGRARDELVLQAVALAAAVGAVDKGEPTVGSGDEPGAAHREAAQGAVVKLSIKQQGEVINEMRARWKELDRLGGATSRALWQRFDRALKAAYEPVAAHVAAQREAREQNLAARQQLLEALDALALPDPADTAAENDWKAVASALDAFQVQWRKLGPVIHTVPHRDREPLVERLDAAVERLRVPLEEARRGARAVRERLIARASSLAQEVVAGAQVRELGSQLSELQAEWQQSARALPLARADEQALWTEFKTAIDAAFGARDAAFRARESELQGHAAERAALIERLESVAAEASPAQLKQVLAEVESAWQRSGPAPRQEAAALDGRFRAARDTLLQRLAGSGQRRWQLTCDALEAKLALCEALQTGDGGVSAGLAESWPREPALPAAWERALQARAGLVDSASIAGSRVAAVSTDDLLLQLEAAMELPSPPVHEAARRALKLQAMKSALERRQAIAEAPPDWEQLFVAALGRVMPEATQRERFAAVVSALRSRKPVAPA